MRVFFLLLLSGFVSAHSVAELDAHVKSELKRGRFIGASVAVVEKGQVKSATGYGVLKRGAKKAVNADTLFQIGSLSKPMTATLAALLQKKNELDIEKTGAKYVLSHTTGYSRAGWNSKIEAGVDRGTLLVELAETKHRIPGSKYDYHNVAFSQIEEMIESSTRQPFAYAMRKNLFEPLKLSRTSIGPQNFVNIQNMAWPHQPYRRTYAPSRDYSHFYHETVPSAAGVNSSIRDMAEFLKFVLSQKDLDMLWQPYVRTVHSDALFKQFNYKNPKTFYGYGFRRLESSNNDLVVFHGGWVKGFRSFMAFSPTQQKGIVILCNSESNFPFKTAFWFLNS